MKKKLVLLSTAVILVAMMVVGGTLAYFTADDAATNVFTIGDVEIDLTEPLWEANLNGEEMLENIYPGMPITKDPMVTNIGSNPAFVRVKVEIPTFSPDGSSTTMPLFTIGAPLGDHWVEGDDGYYYYTASLASGEETSKLFEFVTLTTELDVHNGVFPVEVEGELNINITAEAVQSQGFDTYADAFAAAFPAAGA